MSNHKEDLKMWEAEQELLAHVNEPGMGLTIGRPALVYGPGHAGAMAE